MRNRLKMSSGFLTVEAAVVFPLMIICFAVFIYLVIFVYDRSMLVQDTYMLSVYAREEYRDHKDDFSRELEDSYEVIREEHPYLSIKDMNMKVEKHADRVGIKSSFIFVMPFGEIVPKWFPMIDMEYSCNKEMTILDPVTIMLISNDITRDNR